jgi:uncharacterized LabA/DUF88 family protein
MAIRKKAALRLGIYYDGHYFYKVSNYYKFDHPRQARISIPGLHNYICNEISTRLDTEFDKCKITEAHYFRGRSVKTGNEKAIVGERYFEDALTREGVNLHYLPLVRGANSELKEKGIDVSLALDAYKKAIAKSFDVFILIAGDGDYLPLVRELQNLATPMDVMLVSWDFESSNGEVTMTSQDLLEEVKFPIQMANVIDDRLNLKNAFVSGIFEPRQIEAPVSQPVFPQKPAAANPMSFGPIPSPVPGDSSPYPASYPAQNYSPAFPTKRKALTEKEMEQEHISTILSLNGSGGWIRDIEYNNFYFFYTDVVNKKPEELSPGMTLQFKLKFDRIKTEQKDNGEPSYRAVGPILVVE